MATWMALLASLVNGSGDLYFLSGDNPRRLRIDHKHVVACHESHARGGVGAAWDFVLVALHFLMLSQSQSCARVKSQKTEGHRMPRRDSCCDSLATDPGRTVSVPGSPKYMRDICDRPASMKRDDANTTETQNKNLAGSPAFSGASCPEIRRR